MAVTSASGEWSGHGQGSRHRPRHDELGDRGDGGRPADGHPQRRGHRGRRRRWSRSPRTASGWSASWPDARRSSTRRARSTRPSGSSAAATTRSAARPRPSPSTWSPGPTARRASRSSGKLYAPEEISALVLRKLADDAGEVPRREGHRGGHHRAGATSTTPSGRRPRTPARSPASRCCGSSTSRPRPRSPTGWTRRSNETVLVFDLGGGTFDVSILDVGDGVVEVRADGRATPTSAATTSTGGSSTTWPTSSRRTTASTCATTPQALQRLFEAAEKAKVELSSVTQTQVNLPFVTADASGPKHLNINAHALDVRAAHRRPGRALPAARSSRRWPTPRSPPTTSTR